MPTHIISDLHLGSAFCAYDQARKWIAELPTDGDLVLNGDVVHAGRADFRNDHLELLEVLKDMAKDRHIVWVAGNHDPECTLSDPGNIEFKPFHKIGDNLIVAHGHKFEHRTFFTGICFALFRHLYRFHLRMGGPTMHVAKYARKFPVLFKVFREGISSSAVRFAKQHGCRNVTCGHTHYAEELAADGVRYLNTGSWTEEPFHCIFADDETIELRQLPV